MTDRICVFGHVNPDTDAIASATGYVWLLRERDGLDAVAARAGALNPQTAWVFKRLGLDALIVLDDLPYTPLPDATRNAPGVVSRKKQLLPIVLGILEK